MDKSDPLAGLVDIPLPPVVSLWPQTWPSRIAIVVLILGLVVAVGWLVRAWRANRYRHTALAEIDARAQTLASLALLIRRTALAAFPRDKVVALSGADWLAFLDRTYGGTGFSQGPGRVLAAAPYETPSANTRHVERSETSPGNGDSNRGRFLAALGMTGNDKALLDLVRRWIRTHHD